MSAQVVAHAFEYSGKWIAAGRIGKIVGTQRPVTGELARRRNRMKAYEST